MFVNKTLKPGDEVIVDGSNGWDKYNYKIEKVKKITPTGRVTLENGTQFKPNGYEYGKSGYYTRNIREATPESRDIAKRKSLLLEIKFESFAGKLSVEQLETLLRWQRESEETK